jgi:hypothetical protein
VKFSICLLASLTAGSKSLKKSKKMNCSNVVSIVNSYPKSKKIYLVIVALFGSWMQASLLKYNEKLALQPFT